MANVDVCCHMDDFTYWRHILKEQNSAAVMTAFKKEFVTTDLSLDKALGI